MCFISIKKLICEKYFKLFQIICFHAIISDWWHHYYIFDLLCRHNCLENILKTWICQYLKYMNNNKCFIRNEKIYMLHSKLPVEIKNGTSYMQEIKWISLHKFNARKFLSTEGIITRRKFDFRKTFQNMFLKAQLKNII